MGNLTPGEEYIYERVDNVTYARKSGSLDREAIGWDYDNNAQADSVIDSIKESKLWGNIHRAAKTNPTLQEAINRVKIIYELSKDNGKK